MSKKYLKEGAIELIATFKFIKLLTTSWKKTDAYKEGVIDSKGKLLVKSKSFTNIQKPTYTHWHRLVFNLKRILEKVPFGKGMIKSYAAALFLLREETNMAEEDILKVLEDLGYNTSLDLNEEIKEIYIGQHILNHDIQENIKGTIVNLDSIEPVDYFAGVPIYKTRENILISVGNIL